MKVMPSVELEPDWTTSPFSTLSPLFRMIETPLRIAVAVPASLVTWPITLPAPALPSAWAYWTWPVSALTMIAGEMGAIGRRQRGALLALEVIVQDQFVVVLGKDQVDAGPLEVAVEQQMRVGNDDRIRRRMRRVRGNRLDVAMPMRMQARAVSGKLGVEFASVIQWATAKWLIII